MAVRALERTLPYGLYVADVYHPAPPLKIRTVSGHSARVHRGPPAVRLTNGVTKIF